MVKVLCNENGKIYESSAHAARDLGLDRISVNKCIRGKLKSTGGHTFSRADENEKITAAAKEEVKDNCFNSVEIKTEDDKWIITITVPPKNKRELGNMITELIRIAG